LLERLAPGGLGFDRRLVVAEVELLELGEPGEAPKTGARHPAMIEIEHAQRAELDEARQSVVIDPGAPCQGQRLERRELAQSVARPFEDGCRAEVELAKPRHPGEPAREARLGKGSVSHREPLETAAAAARERREGVLVPGAALDRHFPEICERS